MKIQEFIEKFKPCKDGTSYLMQHNTLREAWENCTSFSYMRWVLPNGSEYTEFLRGLAIHFARSVWDQLDDESKRFVEEAERFTNGELTEMDRVILFNEAYRYSLRFPFSDVNNSCYYVFGERPWEQLGMFEYIFGEEEVCRLTREYVDFAKLEGTLETISKDQWSA